jgi:hypothetical protein
LIPEQYAYFPALIASLNGASAVLLLVGRSLIMRGKDCRASRLHDCRGRFLGFVSGLLRIFPLSRRGYPFSGRPLLA